MFLFAFSWLGSEARGSEARGSAARGSEAKGSEARGSEARGSECPRHKAHYAPKSSIWLLHMATISREDFLGMKGIQPFLSHLGSTLGQTAVPESRWLRSRMEDRFRYFLALMRCPRYKAYSAPKSRIWLLHLATISRHVDTSLRS